MAPWPAPWPEPPWPPPCPPPALARPAITSAITANTATTISFVAFIGIHPLARIYHTAAKNGRSEQPANVRQPAFEKSDFQRFLPLLSPPKTETVPPGALHQLTLPI